MRIEGGVMSLMVGIAKGDNEYGHSCIFRWGQAGRAPWKNFIRTIIIIIVNPSVDLWDVNLSRDLLDTCRSYKMLIHPWIYMMLCNMLITIFLYHIGGSRDMSLYLSTISLHLFTFILFYFQRFHCKQIIRVDSATHLILIISRQIHFHSCLRVTKHFLQPPRA